MKTTETDRGFRWLTHQGYPNIEDEPALLIESSAIGDYPDAMDTPGSSYLWVGQNHHLDREQVEQLVQIMMRWLDEKRLPLI